ncbi:MAG: thiamine pyrophosphate-dependent enzyme [candidate division WOR-3 bacterium]
MFLSDSNLPFCPGCGHALVVRNTAKALKKLAVNPLDVVLVTDIGCHGIIDRNFHTHTVHGIHGRSVALASGIAAGLPEGKTVIAFLGDGGAVIGLQHLIEAAHRNFNLTAVVFNNMLYGMTGGQPSGLTPCGYRTPTHPQGTKERGADLCRRLHAAGAASVERVICRGDFSEAIARAIATQGFSLVEVMEQCPSYGSKHNPGRSVEDLVREAGLSLELLLNPGVTPCRFPERTNTASLLDLKPIARRHESGLDRRVSIMLGGSAGEGVQSAAELFARAAVSSGLSATKRGWYPVTVGTGYSAADIVISPDPILYTGTTVPDLAAITSNDGFRRCAPTLRSMRTGLVLLDEELPEPETEAKVIRTPLRRTAGRRGAALYALALLLREQNLFPLSALIEAHAQSKLSARLDLEKLLSLPPTGKS